MIIDKYNKMNLRFKDLPLKVKWDMLKGPIQVMHHSGKFVECEDPELNGNMVYRAKPEVDE